MKPVNLEYHCRSEDHRISGWRLAFEVDLKIGNRHEVKDLSDEFRTRFESSYAYKFENKHEEAVLKQIHLDLRSTCLRSLCTI